MRYPKIFAAALAIGAVALSSSLHALPPEKVVPGFTLPADERAALLKKAQEADKAREQAKAKGPTLTIVDNGKANATIVGAGKAPVILQEWVKLMSGAELPIQADAPDSGIAIYVGQPALDAGLKLDDIESESDEGWRIKVGGQKVLIAGQSGDATVRAVGRFLEEQFGVRFIAPKDWGRIYPSQKTLKVLEGTWTEKPEFRYRRLWGPEGAFGGYGGNYWLTWAGHGGESTPMSHSWGGVLPKGSFETHPEWYRTDEEGNRVAGHWYNLGNPQVREKFIEWVIRASDGGNRKLSLSPPDDHRVDYSPEARKYDEPIDIDPSSDRVSMTNRFMGIINEAAKKVYEMNPDSEFGFYAYSDYTLPPTNPELDKLSPNIAVWIAPIRFSRYHALGHPHSESRMLLKEIVDGWSKRASKIGWRTYNYNLAEVMVPYSKITTWSHDIPYLKAHGAYGMNLESMDTWEIYAPHLYLSIRLSYDPTLNPWEIMADYWHKAYGPAAEPMMNYWMSIDEAYAHIKSEAGSYHAAHLVYTPEHIEHLDRLLTEAEKLAKGDEGAAHRVNLARRGFRRAQYWRDWYDAINRGAVANAYDIYNDWFEFVAETLRNRDSNKYAHTYLRRFIGGKMARLHKFVYPEGATPNEVAMVLPDEWKYASNDMLEEMGFKGEPFAADVDDSKWDTVRTFTGTLNEQGYDEYFGPMWYRTTITAPKDLGPKQSLYFVKADRKVTVYINGKQVGPATQEAFKGTGIDITGALKAGQENQVTVQVDHIPLPELFLGGLVEPVYLIKHAE